MCVSVLNSEVCADTYGAVVEDASGFLCPGVCFWSNVEISGFKAS